MTPWRLADYEEIKELGIGAHGRVVLARHPGSGAHVAIKYLIRNDGDEEAVERLKQEAVMLARVPDPHVVRLYRFVSSDEGAAMVMEAVPGVSLKELLAGNGAMPPEAALVILKGSLLGLAAAHAVGVIHRDYKPANVVVQADGASKLIDFGIAAVAGVGSRAGSPAYMAPEQWEGQPATPATDVYAATCVFFECVTGARPYTAEDRVALMQRHLMAPVPVEAVPEPLRPLVGRGMAKEATQRPPGAAAFVAELETIATEAYGEDWEQRGVRTLAAGAVALAALFPLGAALIPGASGAAGAVGAGAAGASSMAGGGSAAGSGLLAATGAKVTMAVVATALAVGAGTGAALLARDDADEPARLALQNVSVATPTLPARTLNAPGGRRLIVGDARFVRIDGHTDPAVQRRVNATLQGPLNRAVEIAHTTVRNDPQMGRPSRFGCPGAGLSSKAFPGLANGRLVSVRYAVRVGWVCNSDFITDWAVTSTVDLRDGRALTVDDMFRAETLTPAGVDGLWARVPKPTPTADATGESCRPPARLKPADLRPKAGGGGDAPVGIAFTKAGMTVSVSTEGGQFCQLETYTVGLDRVRDLMKPQFVEMLSAGTPAPRRS
ncbi:serine/threonine-protein kinase [Thermomonospora umbrina]|uniref:Serine/threonine-protein kinase n=1 Tax=Thermomonospora umbrina TaxID=111806 RepID=A0A3D9SN78_9ACTN|nr:serine/threonine-protein kinase [Thermomonospora umbrina]REE95880.1 serine/threonine-protein kinase [Thermomonospora umbrina]